MSSKNSYLSNQEISAFFASLEMLMRAGVPLSESPGIIAEDVQKGALAQGASKLDKILNGGKIFTLHEAMEESGLFPEYASAMVYLGEKAGRLDKVALTLSRYYLSQHNLNAGIVNAISGPALLLAMMGIVQIFLLFFVLPVFDRAFESIGVAAGVGMLGAYTVSHIVIVIVFILLAFLLTILFFFRRPTGRQYLSELAQYLPLTRRLHYTISAGSLTHGLEMMIASGISGTEALDKAAAMVSNKKLLKQIPQCRQQVEEGVDIGKALVQSGVLSGFEARILLSAARSGDTEKAMGNLSNLYNIEAENGINQLLAIIEPALVGVLTVAIGAVLLSVMLPLISIMNAIS